MNKRIERLDSLLKKVISRVIIKEVQNPHISKLSSITKVEITKDLRLAKVYVSIIGTETEKKDTMKALKKSAGFIAVQAAKKISIKYFPSLSFKLDTSIEDYMKIDTILKEVSD